MAFIERLSNLGYLAIGKETTAGVAVIPSIFVPLYKESMVTDTMLDVSDPIVGVKYKNFATYLGQREHKGSITVLGEANTAALFFNSLMNKTSTTGSGPYIHTFNSTSFTNPSTYTIEFQKGVNVFRYAGISASDIKPTFNKNFMQLDIAVAALSQFSAVEYASTSGSGPYTVTLGTTYDPNPTTGLVVGDICQIYSVSGGTYTSFTIASVVNGTSFTTTTNVTGTAGDLISLRGQTPSYANVSPFLWSTTQFKFGATASAAASASQTNVESGSAWDLKHDFSAAGGEHRSGSYDPISIPRLQYDASVKVKTFYDANSLQDQYLTSGNKALVISHTAGTYSMVVTFDQITPKANPISLDTGKLLYNDTDYLPVYNNANSEAFNVVITNNLSTV